MTSNTEFARLCNEQARAIQAWHAHQSPRNARALKVAEDAVREFARAERGSEKPVAK